MGSDAMMGFEPENQPQLFYHSINLNLNDLILQKIDAEKKENSESKRKKR